ncbi:MAG TPA: cell division protein FtsL [Nitrospiria bacterium]|jgi:cell division protein FtsL|nr:cell division protein FtsL [Nitrospiria bacterium]
MMLRRIGIGTVFFVAILLDIWQHVHIVTMGYEVEQAQQKRKELQQIHQQLLVEAETLSALDRIERIAVTKLGMIKPQEGQVVLVQKGTPSGAVPDGMTRLQVAKKGP